MKVSLVCVRWLAAVLVTGSWVVISSLAAQEPEQLPLMLRYDAGGVDNVVKALQWSPDGRTLYVAGWSKLVQVYQWNDQAQRLQYTPRRNFRIPVDAGRSGMLEAMVLSPSGRTLAVAGSAWSGETHQQTRYLWPRSAASSRDWLEVGAIYLFDTVTRECRVLRGHRGNVRQLAFVENGGEPDKLASLAFEYSGQKIAHAVRLWSVATGEPLGEPLELPHVLIPPSVDIPPRIQAWETGPQAVQVAVGQWRIQGGAPVSDFLIWRPLTGNGSQRVQKIGGTPVSLALQLTGRAADRRLFCGGIGPARMMSPGASVSLQPLSGFSASETLLAAAPLPSVQAGSGGGTAIVSVQPRPDGSQEYRLVVQEGTAMRSLGALWTNRPAAGERAVRLIEPAIAVSPDRRFVAASGSTRNEVRVYQLSTITSSRRASAELSPLQVLSGQVFVPDSAMFCDRDGEPGIAVSVAGTPSLANLTSGTAVPAAAIVIASEGRSASRNVRGWNVVQAPPENWQSRIAAERTQVQVFQGNGPGTLLRLPSDFQVDGIAAEVTAHRVCGPTGGRPPLAAVATHVQGEPFLHLYDAGSGRCLRMLRGHERRITHLAFSQDGRLLISASLDGTVRGWMLEDAVEVTGQIGWLRGLLVSSSGDRVMAERVDPASPAALAGLRQGDVVTGFVADAGFQPVTSSPAFYLQVSQTSPQRHPTITLRIQRGDQVQDVAVPLDAGIDIREPLFSLLLSADSVVQGADQQQWLIWSPLGQFDVQGAQLQQQLGWHLNTGDDTAPVSYSSVDQYRDRFYVEGLLKRLLGGREVAVREPIVPRMRVSLVTSDGDVIVPNYEDELVLSSPEGQLVLEFDDQTGEVVQTAEWSAAEGGASAFSMVERDLWKATVTGAELSRESQLISVRVVSSDVPPIEYTQNVFLRYQPSAPQLQLRSPGPSLSAVKSELLDLKVAVDLAAKARVRVIHQRPDGETAESDQDFERSGTLSQVLTLEPGRNVVRIVARNAGIPESRVEFASQEESTLETIVEYIPVGPPEIVIDSITQDAGQTTVSLSQGTLQADVPVITIRGRIMGQESLQTAVLRFNDTEQQMKGFTPGTASQFEFSETVSLQPGEQPIVLKASAGGETGQLGLAAEFRPRLPAIHVVAPDDEQRTFNALEFPGQLPLALGIDNPQGHDFRWEVSVDGTPAESTLEYDAAQGRLFGTLNLTPDAGRADDQRKIEVRFSNAWGRLDKHTFAVRFRHPPQLKTAEMRRIEETALADIVCQVQTSSSRPVTSAELRVNGQSVPAVTFQVVPDEAAAENGVQSIRIPSVALREGENQVTVRLSSRDGSTGAFSMTEVVPPPPQKAIVRMIRPLNSQTVSQPSSTIAFEVESEPGLRQVDLVIERDFREPQRIRLAGAEPGTPDVAPDGLDVRRFEHRVELTSGVNRVRVEVQNRGGVTTEEFGITYLPPPVSISLKRMVTSSRAFMVGEVDPATGSPAFESSLDEGLATLEGRIDWLAGHRPPGKSWTIRVWVNGFLRTVRIPAPADDARGVEFAIPVVLNLPTNRLRIEAPEIALSHQHLALEDHAIGVLQNVIVNCVRPEQNQRLHLVLMGVQMEDGRNICRASDLKDFAAAALRLQTPESAFADIRSYTPLVGEKAIGRNLRTMMVLVEAQIAQRRLTSGVNDVVMFYYRGREHRTPSGEFVLEDFQNYENPVEHSQSISEGYLAQLFEHLPGAHVVFLDIENAQERVQAALQWPRYPNLGLFRATWSGLEPTPATPGPLLSALQTATQVENERSAISLGTIESLVQQQFQATRPVGRFLIETFVPDDLTQLIIARTPMNQ